MRSGRIASGLVVTAFVLMILFVLVNVKNVYAAPTITATPNPVTQGNNFYVSGSGFPPNDDSGGLVVFTGHTCSGAVASSLGVIADVSGNFGPVTFSSSGLAVGTHCITWEDDGFAATSITVTLITTTTSVNCGASAINVGSSTTCTATVAGASGTISGEVISWSDAGSVSFSSSTCTLSGTSCSVTVTGTGVGSASVKASYPGDSNNAASSGTFNLTVNPAAPIPEYPLGLPLLAILMIIGYGLVRRRTRN